MVTACKFEHYMSIKRPVAVEKGFEVTINNKCAKRCRSRHVASHLLSKIDNLRWDSLVLARDGKSRR